MTWMNSLERFPEMRRQFQQAIDSFQRGELREAARLLERTIAEYSDQAPLLWYLGGIYRDLKKPERAIPLYRRATKLAPHWDKPSLALFTALWDADQVEDALEEMKRFQVLTDWTCQDYLDIMDEISEKSAAPANGKAKKKSKAKNEPDTNPHARKIGDAKKK